MRVDAKDEKVIIGKKSSIFELAGKSNLTREKAFRLLDQMREEE